MAGKKTPKEMIDNFRAVYRILSTLERGMDLPECHLDMVNAEKLGISQERWIRYMEMMDDSGYIKGLHIEPYISGLSVEEDDNGIRITLKGLEYLQENSIIWAVNAMKKTLSGMRY